MLRKIALGTLALFAGSLAVAAAPKDDVEAAAKKLADTSYSWKTTVANAGGQGQGGQGGQGQGRRGGGGFGGFGGGGNIEGKVEKGGYTYLTRTQTVQGEERKTEAYVKDGKGAVKTQEGWQGFADLQGGGQGGQGRGRGGFGAAGMRNTPLPAAQLADLASKATNLKQEGDAITGEFSADAAKALLSPAAGAGRGGQGGFTPPEYKNPKGSLKVWLKDGLPAKYEYNLQGTMSFNENEFPVNRTTTTEIKDVGTTKVTIPDEAKSKVS
jgi:hypothetical protein